MEEVKKRRKEDYKIIFFMWGIIAFITISMIIFYKFITNIYPGIGGDGSILYQGEKYVRIENHKWNVKEDEQGIEIEVYISGAKESYGAVMYGKDENTCIYLKYDGELYTKEEVQYPSYECLDEIQEIQVYLSKSDNINNTEWKEITLDNKQIENLFSDIGNLEKSKQEIKTQNIQVIGYVTVSFYNYPLSYTIANILETSNGIIGIFKELEWEKQTYIPLTNQNLFEEENK